MLLLPFLLLNDGSDDEPPDDEVNDRILDATLELAAAFGMQKMTMAGVARRASVGRMTIYRRFGSKLALFAALGERESRRCIAALDAAAEPDAPIAEQTAAGFATCLRLTREHPMLSRLTQLEPDTILYALKEDGASLFGVVRTYMAERLRESQRAGVLDEDVEVEEVAELLVRLGVSFVLIPESTLPLDDEEHVRAVALQLVVPILEGNSKVAHPA